MSPDIIKLHQDGESKFGHRRQRNEMSEMLAFIN